MRPLSGNGQHLLYLDFDGVLHHHDVWWHERVGPYMRAPEEYKLFQHLPLLETALMPYPAVRIILSTSWVRRYGCAKAAKQLGPRLRQRVIGATFHSRMNEGLFQELPRGKQVWDDVRRRKTMTGSDNRTQFEDLLKRFLNTGRAERFGDYWQKRPETKQGPKPETGRAVEKAKEEVKKKRGRPSKDVVRVKPEVKPKRAYNKKLKPLPAEGSEPGPSMA
jgi:hypothetical protein